jgi:cytochrome P450 family 135
MGRTVDGLVQGLAFHRHPLAFLRERQRRCGDRFEIRLAVAGPMRVVADPQAIDELIQDDRGGEARRQILGMVSEASVLGADPPHHAEARGRLEPPFAAEAVARLGEAMEEIADRHAASWPRGRPFRLLPRMRALLDEVFVRLVLGVRDDLRARVLTEAIGSMIYTPGNPPLPPPGERNGLLGDAAGRLFDRRSAPAKRLLAEEIQSRTGDGRHDAIGCLADLPTAEAIDQLLPLLMAGQEPPAAGLTWLLDRVAREPGARERLIEAPDHAYTRAFVRETLRITPAVHSVVRKRNGVPEMVPIVLIHRDPRAFENPDLFDPERFLPDPEADGRDLPFGGGPRRCLGLHLAQTEIASVLPAILRRHRLRPVWPVPERMVVRGTVLVPRTGGLAISG